MKQALEPEIVSPEPQSMAITHRQSQQVGRALTVDELHEQLEFIRAVMGREMQEGQDYGKVPGCGDKPGLFQPGAQKLLMTFQLTDHVKKEEVRDIPHKISLHREYAFTVTVRSQTGREWDGVGTCSTLEGKYRFRKAERKCPNCGKSTIIKGKAEYGGGWICFAKKGGCGAKFADDATAITSQAGGQVEHDNPADYWNTVRKMAFKRALVHAAINATNTSELWSQDLEDLPRGTEAAEDFTPEPPQGHTPAQSPPSQPKPASKPNETAHCATADQLAKLISNLEPNREIATEYFQKCGQLMPNERLEDLPLRFVPATKGQLNALIAALDAFSNGAEATQAFPPNEESLPSKKAKAVEVPRDANPDPNSPNAPWRSFPMPWGKGSGIPLSELDKKYLYGLWANYEVEEEYNGKPKKPEQIAKDRRFREMLDEAGKHYEFTRKED